MTDPFLDELASAYLDGATSAAETARVEADPALLARVDELRRVREAVAATPPPADPARRDAAIAAALAAFSAPEDTPARVVTPLRAPASRRGLSPTARRVLGAAAVVALLALLVPVLGRLGQSNDDSASDSLSSTGSAIEGANDAPTAEDASGGAGEDSTSTLLSPLAPDLGSYEDLDALVEALSSQPQDLMETDGEPETAFDSAGCAGTGTEATSDLARTERATATVAGDAVIVVVRDADSGARTLVVYRADDCTVLRRVPL